MKFYLLGEKLKHSYSKVIHEKTGLDYTIKELKINEIEDFVKTGDYFGFNVTIPYKEEIIKYVDRLDESAKKIGSVNTVKRENGKLVGYNTDYFGFKNMLVKFGVSIEGKVVMILGSGGTSKTSQAVAKDLGAKKIYIVSRKGEINYQNCYELKDTEVIINTTPVGMFPNNYSKPIDIDRFSKLTGVVDCIYNPLQSLLIQDAKRKGVANCSGLYMLVAQALEAQRIWLDKPTDFDLVDRIFGEVVFEKKNIVLEGMPSCGKSTIGKILAEKLGRELVDIDKLIEEKANMRRPDIFALNGEEFFRDLETEVVKQVSKRNSLVIAIGGGSPLREENRLALKQNGEIIYIKRPLDKLITSNRPLSQKEGVEALWEKRKRIYENFADKTFIHDDSVEKVVKEILDYENFSN